MTAKAEEMLVGLRDRRAQEKIGTKITGLAHDPDKQGDPLRCDLARYRRLKMSRYRIIYSVDEETQSVEVVAIGIRRAGSKSDIYNIIASLLGE